MAAAVLLGAVLLQETYAAPIASIAALRAAACCAEHCQHPVNLSGALRCCHVKQVARNAARLSTPEVPTCASVVLPAFAQSAPASVLLPSSDEPPFLGEPRGRDAPLFLLTRSLRI